MIEEKTIELAKEIKVMIQAYEELINKRIEKLKEVVYQYLELNASMGLSTIKANLKTI
jgi:hypothetical protein